MSKTIATLEGEVAELRRQLDLAVSEVRACVGCRSAAAAQSALNAEVSRLQADAAEYEAALKTGNEQLDALKAELAEANAENEELRFQCGIGPEEKYTLMSEELAAARTEAKTAKAELAEARGEAERLREVDEEAKQAREYNGELLQEKFAMQEQLSAARAAQAQAEGEAAGLRRAIAAYLIANGKSEDEWDQEAVDLACQQLAEALASPAPGDGT